MLEERNNPSYRTLPGKFAARRPRAGAASCDEKMPTCTGRYHPDLFRPVRPVQPQPNRTHSHHSNDSVAEDESEEFAVKEFKGPMKGDNVSAGCQPAPTKSKTKRLERRRAPTTGNRAARAVDETPGAAEAVAADETAADEDGAAEATAADEDAAEMPSSSVSVFGKRLS